ncbi:glyoxalase [Maribacter sp. LLG6340-A2]|uniref:glyoxalase n=1 Tax=Maribacter sp. LLG6340-A2 TaxID=3160834 RepID=UPI003870C5B1
MERSQKLLSIRPTIPSAKILPNMSEEERFQNQTLRPILKLQNDLFLFSFQNYIKKMKNTFYDHGLEKQMAYIANAIQKDIKYRNALKGMIIGQFTQEEFEKYLLHSSAYNKRMMNMVIKRLQDQIQFFDKLQLVQ